MLEVYNKDGVFLREVIAGCLKVLNNKIKYSQVMNPETGETKEVVVPFFFDFGEHSNSERFIQDHYTFFKDACTPLGLKNVNGNFDTYPQGRLKLDSMNLDAGSMTNRYVMGKYYKMIDGERRAFVSYLYSLPMNISASIEIKTDTLISLMQIQQSFYENMYKNLTYYIIYKGLRIPVRCGLAEQFSQEKGSSYSFGNQNDPMMKLSMSIQLESYMPVFDPTTEMDASHIVTNWALALKHTNNITTNNIIFPKESYSDKIYTSGNTMSIFWGYNYEDGELMDVELSYQVMNSDGTYGDEIIIDRCENHGFYDWKIPESLSGCKHKIDIIFPNDKNSQIATEPILSIAIDPETRLVTSKDIRIWNKGFFLTEKDFVIGYFSYVSDRDNEVKEYQFKANLLNHQIDAMGYTCENPLEFEDFLYDNMIKENRVKITIKDLARQTIKCEIENIIIV